MRRYYVLLCLLSLFFIFGTGISTTCKAYTLNELNEYINYYESNPDEFTFVSNGNGVDVLSKLRTEFYSQYEGIFNVNSINKIITGWYNYANSSTTKYVIRVLNPHENTTFGIHKVDGIDLIYGMADGIEYRFNTSTNRWTSNNLSNYQIDIGAHWFLILTQNQVYYYVDGSIRNFITSNENVLNTQQQYMFAIPRSSLELTSNGNQYVSAFDIRIGQTYSITDYEIKIYTLVDNSKQYQEIQYYCQQATGTNQYIVNLLSEDLFPEDTYYIELYSQGIKWKESEGQKIKITSGSGGSSGDNGSGGSGVDLSGVIQGIDSVNQSIQEQTQVIYSGDQQIISQLQDNQSFWENTYNTLFSMNSGDVNELYTMVESYFPSGDTPLTIYDTIFGSLNNEPDDFIIRWDDHKLNITWFGGETLYSGDFIASGSINFSKECRDNETLALIKFWFNTFIAIGFLITYYTTLYNCFCHIIGVTAEEYQEDSDNYKRNEIGFKM